MQETALQITNNWDIAFRILVLVIGILLSGLGTAIVILFKILISSNEKKHDEYEKLFNSLFTKIDDGLKDNEQKFSSGLEKEENKRDDLEKSVFDVFKEMPKEFVMKPECTVKMAGLWGKIDRTDRRIDSKLNALDKKVEENDRDMRSRIDGIKKSLCEKMEGISSQIKGKNNGS